MGRKRFQPVGTLTPQSQIESTLAVACALHERYNFLDVIGYENVSPGRKTDLGPAFPMASFRAKVFGASLTVDIILKNLPWNQIKSHFTM